MATSDTSGAPKKVIALGRTFRIRERANLNIRAELTNVFNRAGIPNQTNGQGPGQTSASTQLRDSTGKAVGGFGWINTNPAAPIVSPSRAARGPVSILAGTIGQGPAEVHKGFDG